jgi:hypothetical protein
MNSPLSSRLAPLFLLWRRDPVAFAHDIFRHLPKQLAREWQVAVIMAMAEGVWVAVAACRNAGKSRVAAMLVWWFFMTRPNSTIMVIAPTWRQLIQSLWAEIRNVWYSSLLNDWFGEDFEVKATEVSCNDPRFEFWRIIAVVSNRVENIEGRHAPGGIFILLEEAKGIKDAIFNSIQGMLGDENVECKVLTIGTPGPPIGFFADAFGRHAHLWSQTFQVNAWDLSWLRKHAEREKERLGEESMWYRQQILAEFSGSEDGMFFPLSKVRAAIDRGFVESDAWMRSIGLDVAPEDSPKDSILTRKIGPIAMSQRAIPSMDVNKLGARVFADHVLPWLRPGESAIIDAWGPGAGAASRLRELCGDQYKVRRFVGGDSARNTERFAHKKAEALWYLRDRFSDSQIAIPNEPLLIRDLCSYKLDDARGGKIINVDPDVSPDYGDSLMYAFSADMRGGSDVKTSKSRKV